MRYQVEIIPRELHFKRPARTSRGEYTVRSLKYVKVTDLATGVTDLATGRIGIGECALLPDLSCDAVPQVDGVLQEACRHLAVTGEIDEEALLSYPSVLFGLETALQHLRAGSFRLWDTPFSRGQQGIPINGLIWMAPYEEMLQSIEQKLEAGFHCIKLKIGAIDFEDELALLAHIRRRFSPDQITLRVDANGAFSPQEAPEKLKRLAEYGLHSIEQALLAHIRRRFSPDQITLRVDANGAFSPQEAPEKLKRLAEYGLHSIEQPIRAGQWQEMGKLCSESPIPIALDEELIGVNRTAEKVALLDTIRPDYMILKPSLHGGIRGSEEWIELAGKRGIDYWITSALESNVGLNAIAQWCATLQPDKPQGLGTGQLFTDNIVMPLLIEKGCLWCTDDSFQLNID